MCTDLVLKPILCYIIYVYCLMMYVVVSSTYHSNKIRLKEVPGRGMGYFAVESIDVAELLICETPLVSLTSSSSWFRPTESYQYKRLEQQLGKLSIEKKSMYFFGEGGCN